MIFKHILSTTIYTQYRAWFQIWTEVQSGTGAVNFLTGAGGFLQAVMFGYGGIRLHPDHLLVKDTFLPPATTKVGAIRRHLFVCLILSRNGKLDIYNQI